MFASHNHQKFLWVEWASHSSQKKVVRNLFENKHIKYQISYLVKKKKRERIHHFILIFELLMKTGNTKQLVVILILLITSILRIYIRKMNL